MLGASWRRRRVVPCAAAWPCLHSETMASCLPVCCSYNLDNSDNTRAAHYLNQQRGELPAAVTPHSPIKLYMAVSWLYVACATVDRERSSTSQLECATVAPLCASATLSVNEANQASPDS
jgi:hypothetical protein